MKATAIAQKPQHKGRIPPDLRWEVWERDNYTCRICGSRRHLAIDHILPEFQGGVTEEANLQTLCKSCNSRKGIEQHRQLRLAVAHRPRTIKVRRQRTPRPPRLRRLQVLKEKPRQSTWENTIRQHMETNLEEFAQHLLGIAIAARRLRLSRQGVYSWLKTGILTSVIVGSKPFIYDLEVEALRQKRAIGNGQQARS